jgi:hypothetical protein
MIYRRLVESKLLFFLYNDFRGSVKGSDQSGNGDVFSKEVLFRSPAEFACHASRNHYCELLAGKLSAEEEQEIICLLIVPGSINPSIYHGHFSQVVLGIEDRDGLNPVPVVVSPIEFRVPPAVLMVHVPGPVNIPVGGVVKDTEAVIIGSMVIVKIHSSGGIGVVIMLSAIVVHVVILPGFYRGSITFLCSDLVIRSPVSTARIV